MSLIYGWRCHEVSQERVRYGKSKGPPGVPFGLDVLN